MTNLKPRLRLIDLNELEELIKHPPANEFTEGYYAAIRFLLDKKLTDPAKTKDLLSEVWSKAYDYGYVDNASNEIKENYINNLIL